MGRAQFLQLLVARDINRSKSFITFHVMQVGKTQAQDNTNQGEQNLEMQIISHQSQHATAIKCPKCSEIGEISPLVHEHHESILRNFKNLKELYEKETKKLFKSL